MLQRYPIQTASEGLIDITQTVAETLQKSGARNGLCTVYCPHTTAAIVVSENCDDDVGADFFFTLDAVFPDRAEYRHIEGNSAAHAKSNIIGCEKTLIIEDSRLLLGRWQGVFFAEFDGPRDRQFYVKILAD